MSSIKSKTSNNKIKFLKIGIFIFPLVFFILIVWHKIEYRPISNFYRQFIMEDGPIEVSTAVFYFIAFVLSIIISIKLFKQKKKLFAALYLLLSAGFFFIAFEEISWAQRIFQFETPEFFEDNEQNEIGFHNLPVINDYKKYSIFLVGLAGVVLWTFFTHFNKLKNRSFTKFFVPQTFTMSYFISVAAFYGMIFLRRYIDPVFRKEKWYKLFSWEDFEIFELLLSIGIFIFVASVIIGLKNQKRVTSLES